MILLKHYIVITYSIDFITINNSVKIIIRNYNIIRAIEIIKLLLMKGSNRWQENTRRILEIFA